MYYDFDERPYTILEEDNDYQKQLSLWEIAKGLQATDDLQISEYMNSLIRDNINGNKSYNEIESELRKYYSKFERSSTNYRSEEADFATLRIKEIISTNAFTFSPVTLIKYHKILFSDIESFEYPVGKYRNVNIVKDEDVLNGESVIYSDYSMISDTIDYDFRQEKLLNYESMNVRERAESITRFISNIWQIHPFREGNTRTCAVFMIMYLKSFGFEVDNEPFKNHSKFFRDSLVIANAPNELKTNKYLEMFIGNILFDEDNELVIDLNNLVEKELER